MRSARIPPATNHMSAVAMYMIPIRLWSTVTSQLATRPLFQPTGYAASVLAATRGSRGRRLVDVLLDVGDERVICACFHVLPTGGIAPGLDVSTPLCRIPRSDAI